MVFKGQIKDVKAYLIHVEFFMKADGGYVVDKGPLGGLKTLGSPTNLDFISPKLYSNHLEGTDIT